MRSAVGEGLIVAAIATASVVANTRFESPPRFDGAGYAVLARSLLTLGDYREIDHPDRPRHAHFPPGYPIALAMVWGASGISFSVAHAFSCGCTIAATLLSWSWFRSLYPARVALILGIALAVNWTWGRVGGSIQSEPLFLLLAALVLRMSGPLSPPGERVRVRGMPARQASAEGATSFTLRLPLTPDPSPPVGRGGWMLGLVLGACVLTRHVGVCLVLAVWLELLARGRPKSAVVTSLVATIVVLPWIGWLAAVRHNTQVGLLPRSNLVDRVAENALFYLRRLPDQVLGPLVEVGTVFRPELATPATLAAAFVTAVLVWGWARSPRTPRRRLAGLVPLTTLPLLLIWPFTEAGRFLVPLVPMILVGAVEGLAPLVHRLGGRPARAWAAGLVLAASLPYSIYAIAADRASAAQHTHADFDAACAWLAGHAERAGPILTRQPGEVYWLTGRSALAPPGDDPARIDEWIDNYDIAYFLVDEDRYARSPTSPLGRYVAARPERVEQVWEAGSVVVYVVIDPPAPAAGPGPVSHQR